MLKYPISGRNTGQSIRDTERDNLHIGWDDDDGFVMLFTPDMNNTGIHYHVELSAHQATQLALFLNKKLGELAAKRFSESAKNGNWEKAKKILAHAGDVDPEPEDTL